VATEWVRDYFRERVLSRRAGLAPFAGAQLVILVMTRLSGLNQRYAMIERNRWML
jgi:hypothetical protein